MRDIMKTANDKSRLLELDALRGIAALIVVAFHFTMFRPQSGYGFKLGVTGTDLFFIISGFVIFLSLQRKSSWKQFVINRFARLYPAYWICLTLTALLMFYMEHSHSGSFIINTYLWNLTMFQYYFKVADLDGPYWTLIIELLFYAVILTIFLFKKLEKIEIIGYCFLLFILIYDFIIQNRAPVMYEWLNINFPLINHFPLFFAGILFYKIKFEGHIIRHYLGITCCFIVACCLFDNGGRSFKFINAHEYYFILFIYFLTFILYVNNKLLFIIIRPTLFLGQISYSLYLLHQYIGSKVLVKFFIARFDIPFWLAAFISILICIGIATLVTFYVERPCVQFFKKRVPFQLNLINKKSPSDISEGLH